MQLPGRMFVASESAGRQRGCPLTPIGGLSRIGGLDVAKPKSPKRRGLSHSAGPQRHTIKKY